MHTGDFIHMPFKCFATIKASADGDSKAQREEQQPKSLLRRGPITGNLFPLPGTEGLCREGRLGSGTGSQQSCSTSLGAKPFMSAERGAVCVIMGEREIQVIFFLSLASSQRQQFWGSLSLAGKVKGVKVGTPRAWLFFHTFS